MTISGRKKSKIKDFDTLGPHERRLRLQVQVYRRADRQFVPLPGVGALITVRNADEQHRLMAAIEAAIVAGDWRLPDAPDSAPAGSGAASGSSMAPL